MKSFRDQMKECKKNKNLMFIEDYDKKIILVCSKHKKQCYSGVCKHERAKNETKPLTEKQMKELRKELEANTEKAYKKFGISRRKSWTTAQTKVLD